MTLGFVIVNKAKSRELSWISMNTGAIPDNDKTKTKFFVCSTTVLMVEI